MDKKEAGRRGSRRRDGEENSGIMDERVLLLVFGRLNWDPHLVCVAAQVNRRLHAVANRVLWREVCISRAPRMVAALTRDTPAGPGRVGGGWAALAKLLFHCCGGAPSLAFPLPCRLPGHFVRFSRFSKTSGRSFLARQCCGDLLYVSDPCEHRMEGVAEGEDLGAYRGVFRSFTKSRTLACLVGRRAELERGVRCPYCKVPVWSMTAAKLVPSSAARRLGTRYGKLEYFVCVNGHLHGNCRLTHLSTDDEEEDVSGNEEDGKDKLRNGRLDGQEEAVHITC
ncbi:hypothetical protein HPP92_000980 [Vanilla planifolia]|uniref:EID1-like F-box protein 3 n=1 Tax=Vanilla planifolia TaxID=51239 RepID=A0A835S2S3_VANPL|nr:hypothetical protein HPP92_001143 [Vanilla planifolia]KAG0500908.1 hypothetical protein HPP92_000980 [Vanilla planifolia]